MEEKRNIRTASLLGIGAVVVVILVVILGVPALVRLAVFLGDLKSTHSPVDKNDLISPAPPRLFSEYEATNSAELTISGSAEPGSTVFLTKNSKSVGNVVVRDDGGFEFNAVKLDDGNNEFAAIAVDQSSNKSPTSEKLAVVYTTKSPDLKIDSPTDQQKITTKEGMVDIRGSSNSDLRSLTLNDRFIVLSSEGRFNTTYKLNSGDNTMVFVATDKAGNTTRREMIVNWSP